MMKQMIELSKIVKNEEDYQLFIYVFGRILHEHMELFDDHQVLYDVICNCVEEHEKTGNWKNYFSEKLVEHMVGIEV